MSYKPKYEGPIQGWGTVYARKHYWRVERTIPWDDLLQEMAIVYLRLERKYPALDTPQHFMALFKIAWSNQITTFAHEDTKARFIIPEPTQSEESSERVDFVGDLDNDGSLATKIRQAPREILSVLNLILNAPQELVDVALSGWFNRDRRSKANSSQKICRMLGISEDYDVMQAVEDYFR